MFQPIVRIADGEVIGYEALCRSAAPERARPSEWFALASELDRRVESEVEIVYFGLVDEAVGTGMGRALMNQALALAWSTAPRRVWLHTCTLDHPGAVAFYRRSGFRPYRSAIEVAPDPRLTGGLPPDSFPDVPLMRP